MIPQWQKDLSNVASTYGLTEGDRRELERWFVMLEDVKARLMEDNDGQAEWLNKQTAEIVRLRAAFDACATELRILRKTVTERKPRFVVTLWIDSGAKTKAEAVEAAKELVQYLHRTQPGYGTVDWDVEDWDDDN